jgi:hypothetical protein
MLMALGAFHGINPGMEWLCAVALGMRERRRGAMFRALMPPIFHAWNVPSRGPRASLLICLMAPR